LSSLYYLFFILVCEIFSFANFATLKNHFFFIGRKDFFLHFLHFTFPASIFNGSALIFALQLLQIKMFLKSLFVASGIFAMIILEKNSF